MIILKKKKKKIRRDIVVMSLEATEDVVVLVDLVVSFWELFHQR